MGLDVTLPVATIMAGLSLGLAVGVHVPAASGGFSVAQASAKKSLYPQDDNHRLHCQIKLTAGYII